MRQYWWMAGAALCLIGVLILGRAGARLQKGVFCVYIAALCGAVCAAAGFLCNSHLYYLNDAVFPWLLFLAVAAAQPDEMFTAASNGVLLRFGRLAAGKEGTV